MNINSRNKKVNFVLIIGVIFIVSCSLIVGCKKNKDIEISLEEEQVLEDVTSKDEATLANMSANEEQSEKLKVVYVYVTGCVKNPGVYILKENDRVCSAIESAGGFTSKASKESINLAGFINDGEHIHVVSKSEYKSMGDKTKISESQSPKDTKREFVNINTASVDELMNLPGIGESKAMSIVAYRDEHGDFKIIEDIMNVPGIKDAAFTKIKSLITV